MPIRFTCPHCGVATDVADEFAGRSGPCAHCGGTIHVPPAGADANGEATKRSSGRWTAAVVALGVLAVVVGGGALLASLLLPAVRSARATARRSECANNLRQIAAAVFDYRQRYDVFPPPYIADQGGRPMHSWRVLILPFLGYGAIYDQYDFAQPWDAPDNLALLDTIPDVYRCPEDSTGPGSQTSYLMIVGPGTFSSVTGPRRLGEFADGAVGTIMLIEAVDSGIKWTEPRDFDTGQIGDTRQISFEINDPAGRIRSHHGGGVHAAMCDGSVSFLSEWTTAEQIQAMTTIAGGECTGARD